MSPISFARSSSPHISISTCFIQLTCSAVKNFEARSSTLLEIPLIPSMRRAPQKSAKRSLAATVRENGRYAGLPSSILRTSTLSAFNAKRVRARCSRTLALSNPTIAKSIAIDSRWLPLSKPSTPSSCSRKSAKSLFAPT